MITPPTDFLPRLESRRHCFDDSGLNLSGEDGVVNDQYLPLAQDSDSAPTEPDRRQGPLRLPTLAPYYIESP